ncbi:MAG: aspartate aminotransferase family protein [bacterium]|jgi:putrescine aminotransferase|nr:aspartate aminotransferase family protein [Bacillota bacterium]
MQEKIYTLEEALSLGARANLANHERYVNPALAKMMSLLAFDRPFARAEGMYVWDQEGNRYLDFLGGYGSLNLGHNPPAVAAALEAVGEMPNLLQASLNPLAGALAYNLAQITPGDLRQTFFCNSGAEAVEGALKTARIATGKTKIIYCDGAFHGKSMGALSVTGRKKYQHGFTPLVPGCESVPYGDLAALEEKLAAGDVAAFIVEPIQGEGGIICPPAGYLKGARELCTKYGALLIADEIQTGFGRTGTMFACEAEGVAPDIMCLAKSLGGGLMPIGAFITTAAVWNKAYGSMEKCTLHTSTFGGNSRACAAGLAVIDTILKEKLCQNAATLGSYFLEQLRALQERYPIIQEVRGRGLFIGLEFKQPEGGLVNRITGGLVNKFAQEYSGALVAGELRNRHRIITAYTLNNPNVIRLEPPLIVTKEQIDEVLAALQDIFERNKSIFSLALASSKTVVGSFLR